jgi:hypothetical protein
MSKKNPKKEPVIETPEIDESELEGAMVDDDAIVGGELETEGDDELTDADLDALDESLETTEDVAVAPEPKATDDDVDEGVEFATPLDRRVYVAATEAIGLSKEIDKIAELKKDIATNAYEVGVRLNKIDAHSLWNEEGKFKNFTAFLKSLDFSKQQAYNLINVAQRFTASDVANIGTTKLRVILTLPEPPEGTTYAEAYPEAWRTGESDTLVALKSAVKAINEGLGRVDTRGKRATTNIKLVDLVGVTGESPINGVDDDDAALGVTLIPLKGFAVQVRIMPDPKTGELGKVEYAVVALK